MRIEVLGEIGGKSDQLAKNVHAAVQKMGRLDLIVRVRDPEEIAARGVWKTPALAVEGDVEFIDAVPEPDHLVELFSKIQLRPQKFN